MQRTMLRAKIHRATVTASDLHYVGSLTLDPVLMEGADILEHEQVAVVDVDNGERFETYVIAGERGSGQVQVNGAAARLVHDGDTVIIFAYGLFEADEIADHVPRVVHVNRQNQVVTVNSLADVLIEDAQAAT